MPPNFYKDLFKKESREGFKLKDDYFKPEEKVSKDENSLLQAEFTEEEVKKAVMGSYSDGPPTLMDSPSCFTRISGI